MSENKKYQSPDFFVPKFTKVEEEYTSVFFGSVPSGKKTEVEVEHNPAEVGVVRDEELPPEGLNAVERALWQARKKK